MSKNGIEVITTHVPASSSIEERAAKLSSDIEIKAKGKSVNIIALYRALGMLRIQTGAFRQLTRSYMAEEFNPKTPDRKDVR
ncbi:MAG: hypothetical protein Q9208_007209 [Pyrenodesmia sp. 3 TL-2023]